MKLNTVVFDCGGLSGHVESMLYATKNSIAIAGGGCIRANPEDSLKESLKDDPVFCHYARPGAILLPHFYKAMIAVCEHEKTDYVYCHSTRVCLTHEVLKTPTSQKFNLSQIMVRSWVMLELGSGGHPDEMMERVLAEYQGAEVPHVLTMEISP